MTLTWLDYKQRLWRAVPLLLATSALLAAAVYGVVERKGPVYQVHWSYLVSLAEREEADEFRFDGYYALQATDLFTVTLAAWLASPEVVAAAYTEAGIPFNGRNARELVRQVQVEKAAPQLVRVTVREQTAARAESVAEGLIAVMERNVAAYHAQGAPMLAFRAVPGESWSSVNQVSSGVAAALTFVFSFFLLVNGTLLWYSVRQLPAELDPA